MLSEDRDLLTVSWGFTHVNVRSKASQARRMELHIASLSPSTSPAAQHYRADDARQKRAAQNPDFR